MAQAISFKCGRKGRETSDETSWKRGNGGAMLSIIGARG